MKKFDVQRVESLMRYAEFLRDMDTEQKKIDQVIEEIHGEVVTYIPKVETTKLYADDNFIHVEHEIHPAVRRYVKEQIELSKCSSKEGEPMR